MKDNLKLAFLIVAYIALMAFALSQRGESRYSREREEQREAIYEKGYEAGYNDAPSYEVGFEDGFREGHVDISIIRSSAEHYAREHSGWNPEEALWIIDEYRAGDSPSEELPTKEEYEEAITSLYRFYMYFYSGMYE